jgi:hypothetical protein
VLAHAPSEERARETIGDLLDGPGDVRLVTGDLASLDAVGGLAGQVPDRASTCRSTKRHRDLEPRPARLERRRPRAALRGQ